jgi:hypothetical protein
MLHDVPDGPPEAELDDEVGEPAEQPGAPGTRRIPRHVRSIAVAEAVLLSLVTITAAWSGYSAAKWHTESSLNLAKASATRTEANRSFQAALVLRVQDAADFNAWFSAHLTGDTDGERVAERRFRPGYAVAFRAWLATRPFTSPDAPKGPQYMPEYRPAGVAQAKRRDADADAYYARGQAAASTGDKYIRVTVLLASVLFIVGISSHFPSRVRVGLASVGAAMLLVAAVQILELPGPPS